MHVGVLIALAGIWWTAKRMRSSEARTLVTATAVIVVMFILYSSLGRIPFEAIPWSGDDGLRAADRLIGLGIEPTVRIGAAFAAHPWTTEALACFYAAFIPYLYLTIFLSLLGRPPRARRIFVLAFALLYGLSFMGYLFVPARGPVVAMADAFDAPLQGGFFYATVVRSIDAVGGPHGAFPSLHVGASVLAMTFDLRYGDRLRGLVYAPLVLLISLATVALRYHYVIDLIAGAILAQVALALALRRYEGAGTGRRRPEPAS